MKIISSNTLDITILEIEPATQQLEESSQVDVQMESYQD